jgi:ABC-2 type transport system ATP-binding protein
MKRQVFVALALAIKPKYLLLDEAFDGLDPLARITLKKGLMKMVEDCGSTVIISSHSLRELEDICQGYALLDKGNVIMSGQESTLKNLHKFQAAFTAPVSREDFPFVCDSYQKVGSVVRLVARGDREELRRAIQTLSPLFVEEIDVDFEELFIGEVTQRGYLQ